MRAWFVAVTFIALVQLLGAFGGSVGSARAQDDAESLPSTLVFPTKPEVAVKLQKSATTRPIRGRLIRLSAFEAIVDTGNLSRRDRERGEVGQHIELKRIESLHSTDGRFQFTSDDDFDEVTRKAKAAYSSVRTMNPDNVSLSQINAGTDNSGTALPGSMQSEIAKAAISGGNAAKNPRSGSPSRSPGLGNGGFGGVKTLPSSDASSNGTEEHAADEESSTEKMENEQPTRSKLPGESTESFFCSSCEKEIQPSAFRTGICPHCKTPFSNVALPANDSGSKSHPVAGNGSSAFGVKPSNGGAFAQTGTSDSPTSGTTAPATNTGTVVVQGGSGFSFDSVPNWAKGGLFVLFVLGAYHLLFNR